MGADGIWNPADYITSRYEIDNPYYQGKSIHGNRARANFNKIPQEATDYISGEIQKRLDSGYRLNKWFLRMLEDKVKANWPNDVPSNWDISSAVETDSSMARHINKQNKRVGNTQAQVAEANPGDTVLAGGKSVELSQNDIDKAQQNTGISEENAKIISEASDAFNRRKEAEKQESLNKASQMTEHEQALRENAQKALDEKNAEKDKNWQDQQKQNAEKNAVAEQTAKVQHTGVQQSLQNKSINSAAQEKMKALYGNEGAQQDSSDIYNDTVSEIASGGDAMSMDQRPENLVTNENTVTDESLIPVEQYMPKNDNGSANFNGFKAKMSKGAQVGYNTRLLKQQIANRDKYEKGSVEWTDNNDKAKATLKTLKNYCEPWE